MMNKDSNNRSPERFFKELKETDKLVTPDFRKVWEGAVSQSGQTARTFPVYRYGAAAVILIATAATVLLAYKFVFQNDSPPDLSISQWQSPTLALLDFPGKRISLENQHTSLPSYQISQPKYSLGWHTSTDVFFESSQKRFLQNKSTLNLKEQHKQP